MGKVTVKQYLNTKVNPSSIICNNEVVADIVYPVYLQITYNRKTTQIKSYTDVYMTQEDYGLFKKGNTNIKIYHSKEIAFDRNFVNIERVYELQQEPLRVQKAIEYYSNFWDGKNIREIKEKIRFLVYPLSLGITEACVRYIETHTKVFKTKENISLAPLYTLFNNDRLLIDDIEIIKKITGYDLSKFFLKEDLELSAKVQKIVEIDENSENGFVALIDFLTNIDYYLNSIKVTDKEGFKTVINDMISGYFNDWDIIPPIYTEL